MLYLGDILILFCITCCVHLSKMDPYAYAISNHFAVQSQLRIDMTQKDLCTLIIRSVFTKDELVWLMLNKALHFESGKTRKTFPPCTCRHFFSIVDMQSEIREAIERNGTFFSPAVVEVSIAAFFNVTLAEFTIDFPYAIQRGPPEPNAFDDDTVSRNCGREHLIWS